MVGREAARQDFPLPVQHVASQQSTHRTVHGTKKEEEEEEQHNETRNGKNAGPVSVASARLTHPMMVVWDTTLQASKARDHHSRGGQKESTYCKRKRPKAGNTTTRYGVVAASTLLQTHCHADA